LATTDICELPEETTIAPVEATGPSRRFKIIFTLAVAAYFLLLGYDSVTRMRIFTPDSKYYVEVARFIDRGEGIQYSTCDWRGALDFERVNVPHPMTIWTPLYPVLIAGCMKLGLPGPDAALMLSMFFAASIVLIIYLAARRAYDESFAILAAGYTTASGVLYFISLRAWSETLSIAFLGLAFLLTIIDRRGARKYWLPVAAGAAACASFYARYALLPMAGMVALMFIEGRDWRATLRNWVLFSVTFVLLAAPIFVRNYIVNGHLLGGARPPSTRGILFNLMTLYNSYAITIVSPYIFPPILQWVVVTVFLLVLLGMLAFRKPRARIASCARGAFFTGKRRMFTAWALGYLGYILIYRSLINLDPLDIRLGSPGLIPLAVPTLAFLACRFKLGPRGQRRLGAVLAGLALVMVVVMTIVMPPTNDFHKATALAKTTAWVMKETTPRDLIIGDDLTDVTFLDPRRTVILTYLTDSVPDQVTGEQFQEILKRHCGQYERVFLVMTNARLKSLYPSHKSMAEIKADFHKRLVNTRGVFFADVIENRAKNQPYIHFIKEVEDGYIFSVDCIQGS
jgi:4-amino-4-deoxy-L-arabinose transferase-like glycosyltransferase